MASITLTNCLTDADRTVSGDGATQGDGRPREGSVAVWRGTTNLVKNGGFETGLGNYRSLAGGTAGHSLVRSTAQAKFGSASGLLTLNGPGTAGQGANDPPTAVNVGEEVTASVWVKASVGSPQVAVRIEWRTAGDLLNGSSTGTAVVPSGSWQRITHTATAPAGTGLFLAGVWVDGAATDAVFFDGLQAELHNFATPYVETDGATATRGDARVQVSGLALPANYGEQGWIVMMVTPRRTADDIRYFTDGSIDVTGTSADVSLLRSSSVSDTHAFVAGSNVVIAAAWEAGTIRASAHATDLSWTSDSDASRPAVPSGFDICTSGGAAWLNGEIHWVAFGVGVLPGSLSFTTSTPTIGDFGPSAQTYFIWPADTSALVEYPFLLRGPLESNQLLGFPPLGVTSSG